MLLCLIFSSEIDNFSKFMGVDRFGKNKIFFRQRIKRIFFWRKIMLYFFFPKVEKKNTADFTHSLLFPGYPAKSNFSREIKKYDTFAPIYSYRYKKNVLTNFLWVLKFGQVGGPQKNQKTLLVGFFRVFFKSV